MAQPVTHSQLATLRQCPHKHYLRYELGLARAVSANYLRLGQAFHLGLERYHRSREPETAIGEATQSYATVPPNVDPYEWDIERETVAQLLTGYFWRYANDDLEIVAVEQTFNIPLRNPATGKSSRTFNLAGKIDAIARLPDGRLAILEYKTAGEDISPDSNYWLRLRADAQISVYMLGALGSGWNVSTILYDVTRKPTIQPRQNPMLDSDGYKIVLDSQGERVYTKQGKPRQTGDAALGYTLPTQPETPTEYGARLLADIGARPDYYYQRREVSRTEDDLLECQHELWQQSQQLIEIRRHGRWYRHVTRDCTFCEFVGLCLNNVRVDPASPPSGFVILNNVHPELGKEGNDNQTTSATNCAARADIAGPGSAE